MRNFVYILYSETRDRYYVGTTGDDINERLRRHNTNHKGFTGFSPDWKIVYTEEYNNKSDVMAFFRNSLHATLYSLTFYKW